MDLREPRLIEYLLIVKMPVARIAQRLSRHRSTIYREIRRNRFVDDELPKLSGYYGMVAERKAAERRRRQRKLIRMPDLFAAVVDRLKTGWSPEQIAGRLRLDGQNESLARWLPERRRRRKPLHARRPRDLVFPLDRAIHNRPSEVGARQVPGTGSAT